MLEQVKELISEKFVDGVMLVIVQIMKCINYLFCLCFCYCENRPTVPKKIGFRFGVKRYITESRLLFMRMA
jgi:hypothetical protein